MEVEPKWVREQLGLYLCTTQFPLSNSQGLTPLSLLKVAVEPAGSSTASIGYTYTEQSLEDTTPGSPGTLGSSTLADDSAATTVMLGVALES